MGNAPSPAGARAARRQTLLLVLVSVALLGAVLLAYEQARSEVPRHRAALERLVRAQTGLEVRFAELALRWGWYGPEIILQRVELQQPGATTVLLRAPQLVVGFDAWRSVRTGHPELGRIALIAPEIDLHASAAPQRRTVPDAARAAGSAPQVLQRWRGGRIDIEGGT